VLGPEQNRTELFRAKADCHSRMELRPNGISDPGKPHPVLSPKGRPGGTKHRMGLSGVNIF